MDFWINVFPINPKIQHSIFQMQALFQRRNGSSISINRQLVAATGFCIVDHSLVFSSVIVIFFHLLFCLCWALILPGQCY